MHKFKIGDKVVCIDNRRPLVNGSFYTVSASEDDSLIYVDGLIDSYFATRFKLVAITYPTLRSDYV